jgi:hypothetical protein
MRPVKIKPRPPKRPLGWGSPVRLPMPSPKKTRSAAPAVGIGAI